MWWWFDVVGLVAGLNFSVQWCLFGIAACLQTEKFYDLAGCGSFLLFSLLTLFLSHTFFVRQAIVTAMVCIWSLRLTIFLVRRVFKVGKDSRFDEVKKQPARFFIYWTIQAVWISVVSLPVVIINSSPDSPLKWNDFVGWSMWLLGFSIEFIADNQKSTFRSDPSNKDKWIDVGLWHYLRHPNYFGEILLWIGVFTSAASILKGWQWIATASPVLITFMLLFLSGVPITERANDRKWGANAEYQQYKRNTRAIIPFIW